MNENSHPVRGNNDVNNNSFEDYDNGALLL